ncbi:MAG: hypothetical protein JO323_16630 [Acidobacteriia bacterium]|nr:hypothetical protein [Terriglobia bacterium]
MTRILVPAAVLCVLLSSCNRSPGGGPHGTVQLRDGTTVAGTIISSTPSEIQISGDDKITRSIPTAQVQSIQYDNTAPTATAGNTAPQAVPAAAPVAAAPAPSTTAPPPAAAPAPAAAPPVPAPPSAAAPPPPIEELEEHRQHYHPNEGAVTSRTHEIPAGTDIQVRTEETIDSKTAVEGQTYPAEVVGSVSDVNGGVVIPRGSNAQIVIRSASKGGRFRGSADLVLDLASVSVAGRLYEVSTAPVEQKGNSGIGANKRTAEYSGGGAAIGAIIGAIAGGGKGAAIGAGSGAGAGALTQILTKGTIKVPVETVLTFRLEQPLHVMAAR